MKLFSFLKKFSLATVSILLTSVSVKAAEKIHFIYGPINISLQVDSLTLFAEEGIVNNELAYYLRLAGVNDQQKAQFRKALQQKAQINPTNLSRMLRSPTGEEVLQRMGILISGRGGRNGKYLLRGALVQSAFDQKGLTLLNVLHHLATDIQLNLQEVSELADYISVLKDTTNSVITTTKIIADKEAHLDKKIDFSQLPDIRKPGSYGIAPMQTWELSNIRRNQQRKFKVLVFTPRKWRESKTPVVILSHGLISKPEYFVEEAKHLASHGYVVALPEHIGSSSKYFQDMLDGYHLDMYSVNEFIDRPLDVSHVLDELEKRNISTFEGRLNLQKVGMLGHSFGAYTALALAGATIDFDKLEKVCQRKIWDPNVSLFLQCRALEMPRQEYNFRDERIQAIMVANPLNSVIFGQKGLAKVDIPVIFGAGSDDLATPVPIEQLKGFVWLNPKDKYLLLVSGQAHANFSELDAATEALIDLFPDFTIPDESLIDQYANAFFLAFNEVYINKNKEYLPYMSSAYANYISGNPHPLYLVPYSAEVPLSELFNEFKPGDFPNIYPPTRK